MVVRLQAMVLENVDLCSMLDERVTIGGALFTGVECV